MRSTLRCKAYCWAKYSRTNKQVWGYMERGNVWGSRTADCVVRTCPLADDQLRHTPMCWMPPPDRGRMPANMSYLTWSALSVNQFTLLCCVVQCVPRRASCMGQVSNSISFCSKQHREGGAPQARPIWPSPSLHRRMLWPSPCVDSLSHIQRLACC